ncbi:MULTISPECIES: hypothetical protein [unclassified Sporosarcina]|uniref:hypothetical protein n=1 Tax=unclassified Sporosarcina TaxID=2647733 RepID=UPI00203E5DA3|nr:MULTISPECIES: hypothetical protein [unclassified Sporosarcina]GKV65391.1 hypothetical protein NCCP2331_15440 [Sporosarcina sp. NCCP-2331]GLB55515.1 hypothetical protein NCCP2378_13020 [Sporosarcina sp. NCCP-2378]
MITGVAEAYWFRPFFCGDFPITNRPKNDIVVVDIKRKEKVKPNEACNVYKGTAA